MNDHTFTVRQKERKAWVDLIKLYLMCGANCTGFVFVVCLFLTGLQLFCKSTTWHLIVDSH